jgi:predicted ATPase
MAKARLTRIGLRNFKSFGPEYQEIELAPLTVLLGRNNSGKSTIIQALLLLKQTMAQPRPDVQLHLEGNVDALSLRELTHGWPDGDVKENGPEITIEWTSSMGYRSTTSMTLEYVEVGSRIRLRSLGLRSRQPSEGGEQPNPSVFIRWHEDENKYQVFWSDEPAPTAGFVVTFNHFMPYLSGARGASNDVEAKALDFAFLYDGPLQELASLLRTMSYVGSTRVIPSSIYRPLSSPPDDVGVSGEYAAQLLHARRSELVRFLPLVKLQGEKGQVELPYSVYALPLVDAVNRIFEELDVKDRFKVEDIKDVGFRLLFGKSSIQHVGRGIGALLPIVTAGLAADPSPVTPNPYDAALPGYLAICDRVAHLAMEEPESHLHPKVQTLFAHFLVSLARSARQVLVETHSDHLVRRLRGLIARAAEGSESEKWLRENVNIVEVEQGEDGVTKVKQSKLMSTGEITEHWPADFMDEAPNEERDIYFARMDKEAASAGEYGQGTEFVEETDEGH